MRIFLILALIATSFQVDAQKFGYVNSAQILQSLPEVASADAELRGIRDNLEAEMEKKMKSFQTSYQAYLNEVEEGLLSKQQMADREKILNKSRPEIANMEQQFSQTISVKREELLQPILNKVDEVIKTMGDEGNYTMIFDTSGSGSLLYAPDGDDLTQKVLAKLGVSGD